jgi:hypothetical protein
MARRFQLFPDEQLQAVRRFDTTAGGDSRGNGKTRLWAMPFCQRIEQAMAHLWIRKDDSGPRGHTTSAEWAVMPLDGGAVALGGDMEGPRQSQRGGSALLLRSRDSARETWLVLSPASGGIRLNGESLHGGIRALADGDELVVDAGDRYFFSSETLAEVEPLDAAPAVVCPRCNQAIPRESPAVRCPQCGIWHHQSDELPCWTYSPRCGLCPQPTALDSGFRWTPEGL